MSTSAISRLVWDSAGSDTWHAGATNWYEVYTVESSQFILRFHPSRGPSHRIGVHYDSLLLAQEEAQKHHENGGK